MLVLNSADSISFFLSRDEAANQLLLWIDQSIMNSVILLMGYMCVRRHFSLAALPAIVLGGQIVYDRMLLTGDLHGFLNGFSWYVTAFGRHGNNAVNQQYGMVLTYAVFLAAMTALTVSSKTRSFDRLMTTITATSVITTFTLFHVFLVLGINQTIAVEKRTVESVFSQGVGGMDERCAALSLKCHVLDRDDPLRDRATGEAVDPGITRTLVDIADQNVRLEKPYNWSETTQANGGTEFWVASVMTADEAIYVSSAGEDFQDSVDLLAFEFDVQSVSAHATWLAIFLFIVTIHRRHSRAAIRRALPPEAFT